MKKRWWWLAAATVVILLGGCDDVKNSTDKYPNVVAIYMHQPGTYSFMVQSGQSIGVVFPGGQKNNTITADVPENQPMYAEVENWSNDNTGSWTVVHLHVHSAKDVGGGSYDAGTHKHPEEVQTVPLEAK